MEGQRQKVISYYKNLESRYGYTLFTWDTKHFGYYPSKRREISEKKAQLLMMDLLAKRLQISKNDLVLDAGCGRGTTSCYLAQKYGSQIVGIDIVAFEIEIAKKKSKELGLKPQVSFYLKDYSRTKFQKNSFDKIFTLETLVHSPNIVVTLKEFNRILKPKGKLALFEYCINPKNKFSRWERKMFKLINEKSAMVSLDKMYHDEFPKLIQKAGFKITSDEDISDYILPSLERFCTYAKIPYQIIKFLNLQKYFINTTAGVEFYNFVKKRLVGYRIIIAEKAAI